MHKQKKVGKNQPKTFQVENCFVSFFFGSCSGFIWSILYVKNSQPVFFDVKPPKMSLRFDDVDCWLHSFCRWIGWTVNIDDSSSSEAPEENLQRVRGPDRRRFLGGGKKRWGSPKEFLQKIGGNLNGKVRRITNPLSLRILWFLVRGWKGRIFWGVFTIYPRERSPWKDNQPFSKWLYNNYPKKKR